MKVLVSKKTGIYYYWNEKGDYHCKEGVIKEEEIFGAIEKGLKTVVSNINREFLVFESNYIDLCSKMKRGPQIITPKDLGYILARSGVSKESKIVEAGGGSGGATVFFSRFVDQVLTYEIREEHCKIINSNLEKFNCSNVTLINKDLSEDVESLSNVDLLFLDMPEPSIILEKNLDCVKSGSYICCYIPSISQIQEIVKTVTSKEDLYFEDISEVILRNWKVTDRIARPEHRKEIDHTAFLVFVRKI